MMDDGYLANLIKILVYTFSEFFFGGNHDDPKHLMCHFVNLFLALSTYGEVPVKPFGFTNDGGCIQYLISAIEPLDNSDIIGLESVTH